MLAVLKMLVAAHDGEVSIWGERYDALWTEARQTIAAAQR